MTPGGVAPPGEDLRGLVTGASSGIGLAFARALRARGEKLVLVARRGDRLKEVSQELGGEAVATPIILDLASPKAPGELEAEVRARGFVVDLLVNNAGLGAGGIFHATPVEKSLEMVALNVRALVELTRRFVAGMVQRRRGRIINVASMAAFQPVPFLGVYAASKSFVLSFTESLATELKGTGVVVQALCPGNVPTEFQEVAQTKGLLYDRFSPRMSPEGVVKVSLEALAAGRLVVVPGFQNRVSLVFMSLVPRSLVRRVAGELFRQR
jgi:short-subunit dehydrogenase